jgi:hypothetical protein
VIGEIADLDGWIMAATKIRRGSGKMRVLENNFGWNPIESAPLDEDVTLEVTDGRGARYRLPYLCRLTPSGRISSSKGTPLAVTPVKWKPLPAGPWKP